MNSAPAILCMPAIAIESMSLLREAENDSYPWVTSTPEGSPRYWGAAPNVPVQPLPSLDFLRMMCDPCFEQILCIAQQMCVHAIVCHEDLRTMCGPCFEQVIISLQQTCMTPPKMLRELCNPFFEQMISTALQQALQQSALQQHFDNQCHGIQILVHSPHGLCFQPAHYPDKQLPNFDDASTEADDSSSGVDAIVSKSDDSESTSDAERNIMVCRHWSSKGWCRLGSNCKFLHPECKRGISAPADVACAACPSNLVNANLRELATMTVPTAQRRKKNAKKRVIRRPEQAHATA